MSASGKGAGPRAGPAAAQPDELKGEELARLAEVLREGAGIRLPPAKRLMAETRLRQRARELGLPTLRHYCERLWSGDAEGAERQHLIDALTTNKTGFFREAHHFEFLAARALPEMGKRQVKVWSAGCSSGEEPWTLAMVLAEYAERTPGFSSSILATDVSGRVLRKAAAAIYSEEDVEPVPEAWRRKYLLRSRDRSKRVVRIVPELRRTVEFVQVNLVAETPEITPRADIAFCRNVMIYFDDATRNRLLRRLIAALPPGGYLFLGHSEALLGNELPLDPAGPTIYRKRGVS